MGAEQRHKNMFYACTIVGSVRRKRPEQKIDGEFCALIGEVVVYFGRLEEELRSSTAQVICPAVGHPALFARTRFAELVDMYEFIVVWALQKARDDERLPSNQHDVMTKALAELKSQLNSVNGRRNKVVHSGYLEVEQMELSPDNEVVHKATVIEGFKPFLHRRAVNDVGEFHTSFEDVCAECKSLASEIRIVYQNFLNFDFSTYAYTNLIWDDFTEFVVKQRHSHAG